MFHPQQDRRVGMVVSWKSSQTKGDRTRGVKGFQHAGADFQINRPHLTLEGAVAGGGGEKTRKLGTGNLVLGINQSVVCFTPHHYRFRYVFSM